MTEETRKYIDTLAQRVIKAYHLQIPISDINSVVATLSGTVEAKANDFFHDAVIQKRNNDSFAIITAPFLDEQRKKFVIAQQLGHLFLHMGLKTDPICWDSQMVNVSRYFHTAEPIYQANEFAFALLMPEEEFTRTVSSHLYDKKIDMKAVSRHFQVSMTAAVYRGRVLQCIL